MLMTFVAYRLVLFYLKFLNIVFLQRYSAFLTSGDNQFGFKKRTGCVHAIYTLKCIVDYYASNNSTVNICALDKAFDKMNHHALFTKLVKRHIPVSILRILEIWFESSITCVKWGNCFSEFSNWHAAYVRVVFFHPTYLLFTLTA